MEALFFCLKIKLRLPRGFLFFCSLDLEKSLMTVEFWTMGAGRPGRPGSDVFSGHDKPLRPKKLGMRNSVRRLSKSFRRLLRSISFGSPSYFKHQIGNWCNELFHEACCCDSVCDSLYSNGERRTRVSRYWQRRFRVGSFRTSASFGSGV
ncbi:MAG: hypothetical protein Ct9H300mP11_12450 [Chloroflexota bacterium]|nr:MAG: hypothetical protein Ct9H300mP11_12450 [Chloroflexota bacterium]